MVRDLEKVFVAIAIASYYYLVSFWFFEPPNHSQKTSCIPSLGCLLLFCEEAKSSRTPHEDNNKKDVWDATGGTYTTGYP